MRQDGRHAIGIRIYRILRQLGSRPVKQPNFVSHISFALLLPVLAQISGPPHTAAFPARNTQSQTQINATAKNLLDTSQLIPHQQPRASDPYDRTPMDPIVLISQLSHFDPSPPLTYLIHSRIDLLKSISLPTSFERSVS